MRTQTPQHHVSPHLSWNERKAISSNQTGSKNNSNSNRFTYIDVDVDVDKMATSTETLSVATSVTENSTSFFPEATFGDAPGSTIAVERRRPRTTADKEQLLDRIERILRFAQKRLKRSRVEGFYERKKKRYGTPTDGGILKVQHSDVKIDQVLGNGSYNVVYSVKKIKGSLLNKDDIVVKTLRSKLLSDLPMLAACAADLRKEGLILAALQQQALSLSSTSSSALTTTTNNNNNNNNNNKPHPGAKNIIQCLAWTPTGLSAYANGCHDSFFLILEKLDTTLTDALEEWKTLENTNEKQKHRESLRKGGAPNGPRISSRSILLSSVKNTFFSRSNSTRSNNTSSLDQSFYSQRTQRTSSSPLDVSDRDQSNASSNSNSTTGYTCDPEQVDFWKLRLGLLMDLAGAISFLHSNRVIHRDLKPDNVGFDKRGNLKVFDFDVSRILPNQPNWGEHRTSDTFKMTKKVGSPRYMSPEVARGERYNEKSDVYALGLLAYEVLTLKRPFDSISSRDRGGKGGNVYKDCVQVVVRGEEYDDDVSSKSGRKQKRRNSFGNFPFRRKDSSATDGSSGKLGGMFRRRSHSRGSSKKSGKSSKTSRRAKYANVRPLLPIATPQELAIWPQPSRNSSIKSTCSVKSHHHSVNDIDIETNSFFWTRTLRTTIDQAWSYDIPTRPSAGKWKGLIGEELERIDIEYELLEDLS